MSLHTLRADIRYQDCERELDRLELHIADPAFGRIVEKRVAVMETMQQLAAEHGWNAETETWAIYI